MHKKNTLRLGKLGLATVLVCLGFSGVAASHRSLAPALAATRVSPYLRSGIGVGADGIPAAPTVVDINGKVSDSNGSPLPGVNVLVKGTTIGTVTNAQGEFTLAAPEGSSTLIFTYIGFLAQEVPVGNQTVINVTLLIDQKALGEVVVVGYGTQKRANVTGAIATVTVDEKLSSRAISNVSSGLAGLVPGLSAVQSSGMAGRNQANLLIRGLGSVNNAGPLVVVDGMPDVDINRIDMNDVESITVLKDAASAAVYGSRAANGVILVTTKSGLGKKPTINYTNTTAFENPVKAYDFMSDYPRALTIQQRAAATNTLPINQVFRNGTVDQWMALGMIDPLRYPNTDWWDVIMRNGFMQRHNLSASGGTDASNFYISIGMMDQKGLQINNDYKQYNARINYDYKVRPNMNVGVKLNGNTSKMLYSFNDGFTEGDNTAGFDMQYAIAGILPYDPATGYYGGVMAYNENPQAYNPYTQYVNSQNTQNRHEANGTMFADWSPIEGLTARVDYAVNYYNQFRWSAHMPNRAYNFQTGAFGSRVYVGENAGVSNQTNTGYKTMMTGRLNYTKTIAKNHELRALAVYSEEYWYGRYQGSSRNDRLHPSLQEVDAALTDIQTTGGNSFGEGLRSYIGQMNYTAFDRYLFQANFRADGSSKFLTGSRFGFFPSLALGWRFLEERFINSFAGNVLSNGKLRVSYGSLGNNSEIGRYEQQQVLDANNYMIGSSIAKGFVYRKMVNRSLTWEETTVFNAGLDLGFFNNRLNAELDYYDRLTTGMIRPSDMSIHLSGAYDAPRRNIGNLRNRGVEANLTWADQIGQVNYGLNLNASYNRNILEEWSEFIGRGANHSGNQIFLGMPYGFIYTYENSGIAQTWQDVYNATPQGASPGDVLRQDLNGDGRIDGNDRRAYPNANRFRPHTNLALNTTASWRGIDVAVLVQGATGRRDYWINNYNNTNIPDARYASTWSHWDSPWSLENRTGAWPRLNGSGSNRDETTFWLDDLSFLRIRNVQVGYNLPRNLLSRVGVNNFRIFGSAENLATFTRFRGLDPESTANRNDMYPIIKSYAFGVNLSF